MRIEEYRTRLEKFHEALNRQLYLHCSGQMSSLDLEGVYSDYSDLYSLEAILEIKSSTEQAAGSFPSQLRSLTKIHSFALDQHLDAGAYPLTRQIAEFEAGRRIKWGELDISFLQVSRFLANDASFSSRRRLNEFRLEALSDSVSLREDRIRALQAGAQKAGYKDYLSAQKFVTGIDFRALSEALEGILEATENAFMDRLRGEFAAVFNHPLKDILRCDLTRWIRSCEPPGIFSSATLQDSLQRTVADLGVTPERAGSIVFDLENRPAKQSRASCVPIRIPGEIHVVLTPGDGYDNYAALMHEAGHAHHFAWTSADLPAEHRLCGDPGVAETYAFLFESLVRDGDWLRLHIGYPRPEPLLGSAGVYELYKIRSQIGRLRYGIHLYSEGGLANAADNFAAIMEQCTGIVHEPESCLEDTGAPMDAANYLRGWIAEAMLAEHLRLRFGRDWFKSRPAGTFLKEIWETGNLYRTEELCREIGLGDLEVQVLTDELLEGIGQ